MVKSKKEEVPETEEEKVSKKKAEEKEIIEVDKEAVVEDKKTKDLLIQKGFGEKQPNGSLVLDLRESLYLLEKEKLELENADGKNIAKEELLKVGSKAEKGFYQKFLVYSDLRERGYVVKTGFKFGFDLRVYPRGKKPGEEHTQWVVDVLTQEDKLTMPNFSRIIRLAGNIKTTVLVAVVDSDNDINYYTVGRITP